MATTVAAVAPPAIVPTLAKADQSDGFEERWAAWKLKGARHDRAVRRNMSIVLPILLVLAAVVGYALIGR